uniref:Uncharacterized protein n=1 Tax=uncultured marine virus TaxID=186617 RepID=A0A0F7L739_9VIRU|nr:hypothetical protein [uncultured marine virus]
MQLNEPSFADVDPARELARVEPRPSLTWDESDEQRAAVGLRVDGQCCFAVRHRVD